MLDRLRFLRTYEGYTMLEIANILKVGKGTYSNWEYQKDIIPLKRLLVLTNFYHVDLNYIFGFIKNKEISTINYKLNSFKSGYNLREIRIYLKYSQTEFAQKLNIGRSTLSNYENGIRKISTVTLYTLCKRFNINANFVLGYSKEMFLRQP